MLVLETLPLEAVVDIAEEFEGEDVGCGVGVVGAMTRKLEPREKRLYRRSEAKYTEVAPCRTSAQANWTRAARDVRT